MYAVIFKSSSVGHQFDGDDYRDNHISIYETLQEAVSAHIDWANQPPNKFGYNHSVVYEVGKERNHKFISEMMQEKRRQQSANA